MQVRKNVFACPVCSDADSAETRVFDALAALCLQSGKVLQALALEQRALVTTCEIHHVPPCAVCTTRKRVARLLERAISVNLTKE